MEPNGNALSIDLLPPKKGNRAREEWIRGKRLERAFLCRKVRAEGK